MRQLRPILYGFALLLVAAPLGCKNDKSPEVSPKAVDPTTEPAPEATEEVQPPLLPRLQRSIPLADAARSILEEPMRQHADDMRKLLWSAVMLDYPAVETTAARVAAEPRVSRPMDMQEGVFAESFPDEYIAMEDDLYAAAQALADAAKARDATAMSAGYIKMAGTCMGCHAIYLAMPGSE